MRIKDVAGKEEEILNLPAFLPKDVYHISEILSAGIFIPLRFVDTI